MNTHPKHRTIKEFTKPCDETGSLKLYELKTETVSRDEESKTLVLTIGPPNDKKILTVLLLGETGAGKTHLINALANVALGVDHSDDFRFVVKDQVEGQRRRVDSQTDYITSYLIYHMEGMPINCNLNIIDTPGFGDTRPDCSKQVTERLSSFLIGDFGIDYLHCIGLVEQANNNRISKSRLDILNAFSSLLSRDVSSVTNLLLTFAVDDSQVEEVVRAAGIPISGVYEFDNGPLYRDSSQMIYQLRWNNMQKEFIKFLKDLCAVSPVNVKNIRLLNSERKLLAETKSLLTEELNKIDSKEVVSNVLKKNKVLRESHAHNCKTCRKTCLICKNPSNIKALPEGVFTAASMGSSLANIGIMFNPIIGPIVGGVTGGVIGLAVGIAKRWKTSSDCPQASSNDPCTCCNRKLSEHAVERIDLTNQYLTDLAKKARTHLKKIRELSMDSGPLTLEKFLKEMMSEEIQHPQQKEILEKLFNQ